jgi:subfamily B ATP-binding cassette protein MsbA
LVNLISDPLILLGAIGLIFLIHWKLALYTLIIAPFAIFFTLSLGRRIRKLSRRLQETLGGMTSILQEVITGIKIVKAFAMEQAEIKKFNRENKKFFQLFVKADKLFVLSSPLIELLGALGVSFICWYGGCEVIKGNLSLEMLLVFMVYLGIVSRPIRSVSVFYQQIQHVITCGERIFRILDTPPLIIDKKGARDFKISAGGVEFEKVYFRYQEEKGVLYDINLKVTPGETVAIVGPSGSGKTTLVDLIPRFYEITSGQIKIDGVDIREMKINSLRNQISIVPQEVILFDGTVEENIRYGFRDASFEEIVKASQIANAHSFITKLKDGYRTRIGERGVKLSGGEKQRIAIARAIIKKPAILILDEATSNLDSESEKLIQAALLEILKNQTTFIIAHRISTVINADKIIVLHHGRMVEEGTHQELMKNSRLYKKLYSLQFEEGIEMVEDSF